MKKVLIITLAVSAFFGSIGALDSFALDEGEDEREWYSVAELLEYKKIVDREEQEECSGDLKCLKDRREIKMQESKKYQAFDRLIFNQFLVTSIKPKAGTIKVLYFNEDMRVRRFNQIERRNLNLKHIYIGWFDNPVAKDTFNKEFSLKMDDYFNDVVPEAHLIVGVREGTDRWPLEYDVEVEVPISGDGLDIVNAPMRSYTYNALADYSDISGTKPYAECLRSENFSEEGGCELMVSGREGTKFFAVEKNGEDIGTAYEYEDTLNEDMDGKNDAKNTISGQVTSLWYPGKAPNAGAATAPAPCRQKTIEFPWWLVFVIALGDMAVLWLFWPKKSKKCEKTIDKTRSF